MSHIFPAIVFLLSLTLFNGVESRARLGRGGNNNDYNEATAAVNKEDQDLGNLDNAIQSEVDSEVREGIPLSSINIAENLEENYGNRPWWQRLLYNLQDQFVTFLQSMLRKGIDNYVVPAIKEHVQK